MNDAVEHAIEYIWKRYSEPLLLADIAHSAFLSRFHFSRIFRDATGVSPMRFLTAVRIYQAKRLLLNTPINVTDISFLVGYNSLGSFTNRFTDSVGVSPGRFRRAADGNGFSAPDPESGSRPFGNVVSGVISLPDGYAAARVYVGMFRTPIMQSRPGSATVVEVAPGRPHPYRLTGVPSGMWFIHAVAAADSADPEPWTQRELLIGGNRPVVMTGRSDIRVGIHLRPRRSTDLPVLLALPELEADSGVVVPLVAQRVLTLADPAA